MSAMIEKFLALSRLHKRLISVGSDVFFLLFALWASFSLRLEQKFWAPSHEYIIVAGITVVFTIAVFVRLGLYRAVVRYLGDKALLTIVYGVCASSITLIILGYLLQVQVPRSVPVIYGALAFVFVSGTRLGIRALIQHPLQRAKEAVAIVGAGATSMQLASALQQGTEYRPVVFM